MDNGVGSEPEISLEELENQITELAGHLNAANYRWLTLIAEFDRRNGWWDGKLPSCAHWLNFKVGLNLGAAREKVRVAHALDGLPKISASMARGELSYSKVRALTRIASSATEDGLLMIALHGTAHHVERLVKHYRRAEHVEELQREDRQAERCRFTSWHDSDGSLVFHGRMPALAGAAFLKALDAAMEAVPAREPCTPANGRFDWEGAEEGDVLRPYGERRADALRMIAESFLQHGPGTKSAADRYQIVVHVDAMTLREGQDGRCEFENGPTLPVETARRLSCDASLVSVIENERGEPLNVGRKTRIIPPALRRALNTRDEGCRFPGCTYHQYVDAHHVEHWADGGETKLSNLITLCRAHHRMVHKGEIVIKECANGGWEFFSDHGRPFRGSYSKSAHSLEWNEIQSVHERQGICIDARTAVTRWEGERMDYDMALSCLFGQRDRHLKTSENVSAETFA
ncbi:MAG TPA: DUF222 domain-containing protein [Steroidobacteraceae bacterium]|jgi:hypothetical protein